MARIREFTVRFPYIDLLRTQEGTQAWSRTTTQQGRILLVKIHGQPFDLSIIQVYAPISASTEEEIEDFYSALEEEYGKCGNQYIVIVMGDMNAKVGSEQDPLKEIVGGHGLA